MTTIALICTAALLLLERYPNIRAGAILLARDLEAGVEAIRRLRHRSTS